MTMNILLQI